MIKIQVLYIPKPMPLDRNILSPLPHYDVPYKGNRPVYQADLVVRQKTTEFGKYEVIKDIHAPCNGFYFKSKYDFKQYAMSGRYKNVILIKNSMLVDMWRSFRCNYKFYKTMFGRGIKSSNPLARVSLTTIVQTILIILKLVGIINWPWPIVFMPLCFGVVLTLIVSIMLFMTVKKDNNL